MGFELGKGREPQGRKGPARERAACFRLMAPEAPPDGSPFPPALDVAAAPTAGGAAARATPRAGRGRSRAAEPGRGRVAWIPGRQ
ncbi:hypothetical protein GCM10009605_53620 [Nocardiopsis composta]